MLELILGGAGSGKSAYAEERAVYWRGRLDSKGRSGRLLYLATMRNDPKDAEALQRIQKHRIMRAGKGFDTMEQPCGLGKLTVCEGDVVLLEDLANLLANEWYGDYQQESAEICSACPDQKKDGGTTDAVGRYGAEEDAGLQTADRHWAEVRTRILNPILGFSEKAFVIVVGSDVMRDGRVYEEESLQYIRRLAFLQNCLAEKAKRVTEVVFGIPCHLK